MEITIRTLRSNEAPFVYSNEKVASYVGLIGYLRADFDTTGDMFYSTWNEYAPNASLNNANFKKVLDTVINSFRKKGELLENRKSMYKYCVANKRGILGCDCYDDCYGFRVDCEDHTFLMRCTPVKGAYDLYCYCYEKALLDEFLCKSEGSIPYYV